MNEGFLSPEAFYSNLKKTNISEDEYNLVKQTWQENNWQTLRDLLIFYNMIDVGPFVEAITKMKAPYLEEGLDIFKTTFSISGVARLLMIKKISKSTFFCIQKDMLIYTNVCAKRLPEIFSSFSQESLFLG